MKIYSVLVSGPTVSQDMNLINSLKKNARVLRNGDNRKVESILSSEKIDVIILEISSETPEDVEIIKYAKAQHRQLQFILIDGERELVAKAISYGVRDVFRKPYRGDLLSERVYALMN